MYATFIELTDNKSADITYKLAMQNDSFVD